VAALEAKLGLLPEGLGAQLALWAEPCTPSPSICADHAINGRRHGVCTGVKGLLKRAGGSTASWHWSRPIPPEINPNLIDRKSLASVVNSGYMPIDYPSLLDVYAQTGNN